MRKGVVALGAAVIVVGIVAGQLWLELRAERARGSDLVARAAQLEAMPPVPALAPPVPEPVVATVATALPVKPAQGSAVTTAAPAARPSPDTAKAPAAGVLAAMQSPQGQDLTRSMMRAMMSQMYPDIQTELDLTAEETSKLFDLLTKQQEELGMESLGMMTGSARDPAAMRESQRRMVEKERLHEQELTAMLGSKHQKWKEYEGTAAARQQVEQLRITLSATGNPLSEAQSKSLVTAFAAERGQYARQEREWMASPAAIESPNLLQESMQRAVDSQRRLVGVATPHLSSVQAEQFRRQVEQQADMLRATMGLLGGQAGTP